MANQAIYCTFRNFFLFLNCAKLSQDLLEQFSRFGVCVNVVNLDQIFPFLKGPSGKIGEMTFIQFLGILKPLEYRNMDKQFYSANDPSTSCTNCVNFGPITPEIEV